MAERTLFISDLHLEPARPDITRSLKAFLAREAGQCQALYILGDLFEVWIGDDDESSLATEVASALHAFHIAGARVYLMHGNRDFLLGTGYADRCGATLITEPYSLPLADGEILLLHGDSLCTDDVDYQKFRAEVRAPDWQQAFLARSLEERRDFARKAREQSRAATAGKAMSIMDVNGAAVQALLQETGQHTLLHGHTHRPAIHELAIEQPVAGRTSGQRIVLGSWEDAGWFAESDGNQILLHKFSLSA